MIRQITPDDMSALIALMDSVGLFQPDHLDMLSAMLTDYFDVQGNSDQFWIVDEDDGLVGIAYCEPEMMTDQAWNLQLIAVRPDRQRQGRGAALLHQVEQMLIERGGRILLVETSGLPAFERTRSFYTKCGFEEEARIRDFYAAGEDKVIFRKSLDTKR